MRKVVNFCDYFVICSAPSDRRIRAIADGIDEGLGEKGIVVRYRQGDDKTTWLLLDIGDVVVHIFDGEMRGFYGLEHLWQDALRVNWEK